MSSFFGAKKSAPKPAPAPAKVSEPAKTHEPVKPTEPPKQAEPVKPAEALPAATPAQVQQNEKDVIVKKDKVDESDAPLNCAHCSKSLIGQRYVLKDEKPYCIPCYEEVFSNVCFACKVKIDCEQKDLSYRDRHWHEQCFVCEVCKVTLADKHFASKDDAVYCIDCYDEKFAARCDGCTKVFKAGMKKYEYRGKSWHEECFLCMVCKKPIGNKSFIPRDQEVCCIPCYEEHFAQRCKKCNGVINKGGVTYRNAPYHRECFGCTNCLKELAGIKFTSKDEQPYCADCYGVLFARKCVKCTKPIMGFGGTKFISFDERNWHSDCFNCYRCQASLVGKGFLLEGEEVLCAECGR